MRALRYVRPIHAIAKWSLPIIFLALFPNAQAQVPYLSQEVQVHDLPLVTARSHDPSDVLLASSRSFCTTPKCAAARTLRW